MKQAIPFRTITTLSGNSQKLDGGAMLVREPGRNVLVEAGIGAFFSPGWPERISGSTVRK